MAESLAGKVAWITGGGSGLGLYLAVELARRGCDVAVSGRRVDRLAEAVAAIEATGRRGYAVACDVTDDASVAAAVAEVVAKAGRLDIAARAKVLAKTAAAKLDDLGRQLAAARAKGA